MNRTFLLTTACAALMAAGYAHAQDHTMRETSANSDVAVTTTGGTVTTTTATTAVPAVPATIVTTNPDGSTTTTTTTYYVDYDKNNNGILDANEFNTYAYSSWDLNHDGWISDAEWKLGSVRWYGTVPAQYNTYTYWDKNGDGRIDATEFDTTVTATPLYSVWDTNKNGTIDNDEYAARTFRMRDLNGDGMVSMDEWRASL